jgi:outer membrane receptor for ferrienterochelin and colicin
MKKILNSLLILLITLSSTAQTKSDTLSTQSDSCNVSFLNENLKTMKSYTSTNHHYSPKSINIRGINGRQPLIIIDGVISNHGSLGLNPSDIQSISVRKDERIIKLYGEKANDGVILITTKKKAN